MALFKIYRGNSTNLGKSGNVTAAAKEGFAYFTPDDGKMYIDIATANTATLGTNRILLNAGHADSATLASKASAFDHSVSVVLTGDVTGSASSTGSTSWSIATTASRMRHGAITV